MAPVDSPPSGARRASPAASEDLHDSDEELLDRILTWGPAPPRKSSQARPASCNTPPGASSSPAVKPPVPMPVRAASPVEPPAVTPVDTLAVSAADPPAARSDVEMTDPPATTPVPSLVMPSVETSDAASPTPDEAGTASVALPEGSEPPRKTLAELIYEVRFEWSSDDDLDSDEDSDLAEDDASSSQPHTGLTDDSEEEEKAERPTRTRLCRGDETSSWHPPLSPPPARHPTPNHLNQYDPDAPWDYDTEVGIVRLLDVHGEVPHRCYLVRWKGRPLQMSWVWMEQLDKPSTRDMMKQVDEWKASGTSSPFTSWHTVRDTASPGGTCFMNAFRSALYYLGQPQLVTMEMWETFEATRPGAENGVTRDDVMEFFKDPQRKSLPLNYDHLLHNLLPNSSANITTLKSMCQALASGAYLASAGEDGVGHCFVAITNGPSERVVVLDGYNDKKDPPVDVYPLNFFKWAHQARWLSCVELQPGYVCRHGKRKSNTMKKRERQEREKKKQKS